MIAEARLSSDREATGSFLEAMLAMMVISCAMCLLTAHLPGLLEQEDPQRGLRSDAENAMASILDELKDERGTVRERDLQKAEGRDIRLLSGQCCKVEVHILAVGSQGGERREIHRSGQMVEALADCLVLTEPIALEGDGGRVRAALLVVMVW